MKLREKETNIEYKEGKYKEDIEKLKEQNESENNKINLKIKEMKMTIKEK